MPSQSMMSRRWAASVFAVSWELSGVKVTVAPDSLTSVLVRAVRM